MAEVKNDKTTERLSNSEAHKIYQSIKAGGDGITGYECWKARNTYDFLETAAREHKEDCQDFYYENFEQISLYPDGNGGNVSANGQIVQPPQPVGYDIRPRKLLQFARKHIKVNLEVEQGYEYLLDILSAELHIDHSKVSSQHVAGTLHVDLKPYISDAPIQLQIGVAHVKKGGNNQ